MAAAAISTPPYCLNTSFIFSYLYILFNQFSYYHSRVDTYTSTPITPASNQTVAPEPAQSEPAQPEAPKNEYVAPGWIFYGSKAGNGMSGEQKAYVDSVIQQWTNGGLSDDAIGDMFIEKIAQEWQLPMITAGVTSNLLCLFPSRAEVTDYSLNLADMNGAYNFVGLYTKGEYDENGYLKCYYWEAGVL